MCYCGDIRIQEVSAISRKTRNLLIAAAILALLALIFRAHITVFFREIFPPEPYLPHLTLGA